MSEIKKKNEEEFEILKVHTHRECIEEKASWLSKLFFYWTGTVINTGKSKIMKEDDLFDIISQEKFSWAYNIFFERNKYRDEHNLGRNYFRSLVYTAKGIVCLTMTFSILANLLQFSGPIFLGRIILYLNNTTEQERAKPGWEEIPVYWGWVWASCLLASFVLRTFLQQHAMHLVNRLSLVCGNALSGSIYEKVLKVNSAARKFQDPGKVMNLINVDTQTIVVFCQMVNSTITIPMMIVLSVTLICLEIGVIGLIGPGLLIVAIILQNFVQAKTSQFRKEQMQYTDKRSKALNEFFTGIKIIKYYAWEKVVNRKVSDIRKKELALIYKNGLMLGLVDVIATTIPIFMMISIFGLYTYLGNEFGPAKAYTVLSYFNLLLTPLRMVAFVLLFITNSKVALKRIQHYSLCEERSGDEVYIDSSLPVGSVEIKDGNFAWDTDYSKKHAEEEKKILNTKKPTKKVEDKKKPNSTDKSGDLKQPLLQSEDKAINQSITNTSLILNSEKQDKNRILHNINFSCKQGEFVAIVGQVGTGKSSFLHTILGEMIKESGNVCINGTIAYVSQTAWLMNASIKDNILFGKDFNEMKYKLVLKMCELEGDLEIFPGGDLTEIGERGVNLSGGQKQRVSLARAVYHDADIYLIDDCLSALDAHVGKAIFENVLKGILKGKTIIFVTHALHYVPQCDRIVVFKNGSICEQGTFKALIQNQESEFSRINVQFQKEHKNDEKEDSDDENPEVGLIEDILEKPIQRKSVSKRSMSKKSVHETDDDKKKKEEIEKKKLGALVKIEEKSEGSVPWKIYKDYLVSGGKFRSFLVFSFYLLTQGFRSINDWWLGIWSAKKFDLELRDYICIYAGLSIGTGILVFMRAVVFGKWSLNSAKSFQEGLLNSVLRCPMSWFDVTPTGRILSRTTKDQDAIDNQIPWNLSSTFNMVIMTFASILISGISSPLYFVVAFILAFAYTFMVRDYINGARETKRMELTMRSPMISHLGETLNGITTIKAFGKLDSFRKKFEIKTDNVNRASQNFNYCGRWIAFRSDLFGSLLVASTAYFGVLSRVYSYMDPTLVGLALSSALTVSSILSFLIRSVAMTESQMSSVQRIVDYLDNNPSERDFDLPKPPVSPWPTTGTFKVENITYRYRANLDNVIHGISFSIGRSEKIGVVGRTGSGKSTLTLGILRILELVEDPSGSLGKIELDGVDISQIGLHELRNNITIIPQDPTLFTETIRFNVDPFKEFTDENIVDALKKVHIWESLKVAENIVPDTPEEVLAKLKIDVTEGGGNFSLGQRQLICMARALIRKPKVLLMDEATASIDEMTDHLIQKMIREEFLETTVITIAHRLNTIIQYDRILVLDRGQIAEFDTPLNLLEKNESYFGRLIKEQGTQFENKMYELARKKEMEDEMKPGSAV